MNEDLDIKDPKMKQQLEHFAEDYILDKIRNDPRVRINLTRNSKGYNYEVTIEMPTKNWQEVLDEIKKCEAELNKCFGQVR